MRGPLRRVCARTRARAIGQCHGSDLALQIPMHRADLWESGEGRSGEGRASEADSIWSCRAWLREGRFRPGHRCHLRGAARRSALLNEERSHPLWSDPKRFLQRRRRRRRGATRRGGEDAVLRAWKERNNGTESSPETTQSCIGITMNI